jgi:hypothetical protein
LKCSENHKLKLFSSDTFIYAKDIYIGSLISSDNGYVSVIKKKKVNSKIKLYDALSVNKKSRYYTDGLVSSNCAFMEYSEDIWLAAQPTLSTGGSAVILSTPNGTGNFFHKMWVDGEANKNGFNTISLKWNLHPERDQNWRDEQTKNLGVRESAQECDCNFSTSGNTVIKADDISFHETLVKPPIEKRGPGEELWIWQRPDYTRRYLVSADVARGDGTDFNAFHVLDIETMEQVAEYEGRMSTKDYGNFLVSISTEYNNALLVIENNSYGWATIQQVIDRKYDNLFYSSDDLLYIDAETQMTNKINQHEKKMTPGFATSSKSRPLVIAKLELYLSQKEVNINSIRLLEQLRTFIWKGAKAEAAGGYNDDIIMSYGIALWIRDTALKLLVQSTELNRVMLNGIGKSQTDVSSAPKFGGVYKSDNSPSKNPWEMRMNGKSEDLTWLIR